MVSYEDHLKIYHRSLRVYPSGISYIIIPSYWLKDARFMLPFWLLAPYAFFFRPIFTLVCYNYCTSRIFRAFLCYFSNLLFSRMAKLTPRHGFLLYVSQKDIISLLILLKSDLCLQCRKIYTFLSNPLICNSKTSLLFLSTLVNFYIMIQGIP